MMIMNIKTTSKWILATLLLMCTVALLIYTSITLIIIATILVTCLLAMEAWDMFQDKKRSVIGILIFAIMVAILVAQIVHPHLFLY